MAKAQKQKSRECKVCGKVFRQYRSTQAVCSRKCAIEFAKEKAAKRELKARNEAARAERKATKERKEKLKTKSDYAKEAQQAFNRYIRARDKNKPCISCGTTKAVQYAAGHFKTVGAYPELRFNTFNVHKQCNQYCNCQLSGNLLNYRKGLIERYGAELVDYLESKHESKNYTIEDLKRIKRIFNKRARWYEKRSTESI